MQGEGWTPAGELQIGDLLASHDGHWTPVTDLLDTSEWLAVYNFRIADYHTYFVGDDDWGFSVWAHNATYSATQIDDLASKYATARLRSDVFSWEAFAAEVGEDLSNFTSSVRSTIRKRSKELGLIVPAPVDARGVADFSSATHRIVSQTGQDMGVSIFVKETLDLKYGSHFSHLDSKYVRPDTHVWDHMPIDGSFQLVDRNIHAVTPHKGYELWTHKA